MSKTVPGYYSGGKTCSYWDVSLSYFWRIPAKFLSWVRIPAEMEKDKGIPEDLKKDELLAVRSPNEQAYISNMGQGGPLNGIKVEVEKFKNLYPPLFERLGSLLDPRVSDEHFRLQCAAFCESTCLPLGSHGIITLEDDPTPFDEGIWFLGGLKQWRELAWDFRRLLNAYRVWQEGKDGDSDLVHMIRSLQEKYPTRFELTRLDGELLEGVVNKAFPESPPAWAVHDLAERVALSINKRKGFEYRLCPECRHYGPTSAMTRVSSLSEDERTAFGYPLEGDIWLHRLSKINVNQNAEDYLDGLPPDCYQKVRKRVDARKKALADGREPGKRGRPRKQKKTPEGVLSE